MAIIPQISLFSWKDIEEFESSICGCILKSLKTLYCIFSLLLAFAVAIHFAFTARVQVQHLFKLPVGRFHSVFFAAARPQLPETHLKFVSGDFRLALFRRTGCASVDIGHRT